MDFNAIKAAAEHTAGYVPLPAGYDLPPQRELWGEGRGAVHPGGDGKTGLRQVEIDGLGNVIGWMGEGTRSSPSTPISTPLASETSTTGKDPYQGYETDDIIYGRGGSDQEGGMASAVYGAKIMKDLD